MKRTNQIVSFLKEQLIAGLACMMLLAVAGMELSAQQLPQLSQYRFNSYVINPAVAGCKDYYEVKAMNRYQWTGITDAPRTFTLSLTVPFKNPHMGMGGYLYADNVGPTRRTGAQVSYSWIMNLTEKISWTLAASGGVVQYSIDGSRIELAEADDPALYNQMTSSWLFDAKFGTYVFAEDWYFGIALPQLAQNKVNLFDSETPELNKLEDHYVVTAGYSYDVGESISIEPSVLVKYVAPTPVKIDASLMLNFKDMLWLGGSWRNNDAWVAMVEYEYKESISIGYAYDFTTSDLRDYSDGTHEIVLGFRINQ